METFGTAEDADWRATDIESADGLTHFKVRRRGEPFGRFASPLLGVHNVRNAVAAIAVGSHVGIGAADLADGLRAFKGIKRRLEIVGTAASVTVLDDFAHHPTAVHETLAALRTGYPDRRIWAVVERRLRRHSPEAVDGAGRVTVAGVRLAPGGAEGDPGSGIRIVDAGDAAVLLELEAAIDPSVNARAIAIAAAVAVERRAGVRDVIPTYRSVAVHFDPLVADVDGLRDLLRRAANSAAAATDGALVEVPVAYGGEHGPDLDEVATFAKLSPAAVIERHCATEYRVFMLGFLPGFAYMGSVDDSIAAPRKATPRTRIPAGSVGIAGRQTGIYPRQSPGGWQLIGRTGLQVFDPFRSPASLFAPGDRVRFVAAAGIGGQGSGIKNIGALDARVEALYPPSPIPDPHRRVTVIKPGLFTTIQDAGRWGQQDRCVPVAGPMDRRSYRLANALVGNPPGAAALEATLLGPELRIEQPARVAIAGADLGASIDGTALAADSMRTCGAGSVLRFGERRHGTRVYIALDGGIDVPLVLGSRATTA